MSAHRTESPSVIKGKHMDIPGLDTEAFDRWIAYRRAIKKPYKDVSLHAAAVKLAKYGDKQAEVVEQSIANQWQGLFDLQVKKLQPGEKPVKTDKQKAADDAYWQASVQRAEKNWSEMIPTAFGRLKICDALWARYTVEVGPDTPEKLDWLKGVVSRNLKEVEAKHVVNDPNLMVMVMCFFGPSGVKRIRERAAVGA
jgi:hypothetical protein